MSINEGFRSQEPATIFVHTVADGTKRAIVIGHQSGAVYTTQGWATVSAMLEHVASHLTSQRTSDHTD